MRRTRALARIAVLYAACQSSSCAPSGFPDASLISSVRILASSAEPPNPQPGTAVRVRVLAYDGRSSKPAPMVTYWLPLVCTDPENDAYYSCFKQFAGAGRGDAGARADAQAASIALVSACGASGVPNVAALGALTPGVDLTPLLPQGDCAEFVMPADIVPDAGPAPTLCGSNPPEPVRYGLAILFNIACAGHLEVVALDPGNVQSPPVGCFDAQHNRLGPPDYVFGFTRVYAYDAAQAARVPDIENANPMIDHIEVEGQTVNLDVDAGTGAGFDVDHCPAGASCQNVHIGPVVLQSSQELNPTVCDVHQNALHEQVWAEFYSTLGSFTSDARLLYDPSTTMAVGAPVDTDTEFEVPAHAVNGTIWIVVHDNRGGATWATVPVRVH